VDGLQLSLEKLSFDKQQSLFHSVYGFILPFLKDCKKINILFTLNTSHHLCCCLRDYSEILDQTSSLLRVFLMKYYHAHSDLVWLQGIYCLRATSLSLSIPPQHSIICMSTNSYIKNIRNSFCARTRCVYRSPCLLTPSLTLRGGATVATLIAIRISALNRPGLPVDCDS